MQTQYSAFSLLEILITLAITCILLTIAYPSYIHHLVRVRRQQAKIALLRLASRIEESYQLQPNKKPALSELGIKQLQQKLPYTFKISFQENDRYTIQAIPQDKQAKRDIQCGTLILTASGKREISGSDKVDNCW